MTRPPILEQLRQHTRARHDRLEAQLSLLDETLSPARYAALLVRFHAVWQGLDPKLASLLDPAFWTPRRRLPWLDADLAALRLAPPPAIAAPTLASEAAALGALYVVEGSTLGGRIILRHLHHLGLQPATYFNGYGDATGPMWKAFVTRLDAAPPATAPAILAGASLTFDHLQHGLTQQGQGAALDPLGPAAPDPMTDGMTA